MYSVLVCTRYKLLTVCVILTILVYVVNIRRNDVTRERAQRSRDQDSNQGFSSRDVLVSPLQVGDNPRRPVIPRIIHQTWDHQRVPRDLIPWIRSWIVQNPGWTYWFWTPDDVRRLLKHSFQDYLELYNSYHYNIFRSDIMRYFIMEKFGGFYVDLDMDCLQSLEPWIYKYSCLLSLEPHEHPYFGFGRNDSNVMNTIIASRPGHPFWRKVIESLQGAFKKHNNDVQLSTGPLFLNNILKSFGNDQSGSVTTMISFEELESEIDKNNSVTVLPPKYFLPTYDYILHDKVLKGCAKLNTNNQDLLDVCERTRRNETNKPGPSAYTNHHWIHMFLKSEWKDKPTESIVNVLPEVKVKSYNQITPP